jgi:hypothetical protein
VFVIEAKTLDPGFRRDDILRAAVLKIVIRAEGVAGVHAACCAPCKGVAASFVELLKFF